MKYMPEPRPAKVPQQFADMAPTGTGTLVVWSKCDRLTQGEDGTVNDLRLSATNSSIGFPARIGIL